MKADTSLVDLFLSLIKIDAVSGSEKPVADFICDYVRNLGFEAHVDDAHVLSGGNTGNVVVPVLGGGDFLLMAHMDTPRSTKGVNPLLLEDRITSDHTTILGVDDRGGISSILWALRYAVEHSMPLKPCTLLFTVCEETSLAGSCAFRPSPQITHGFVFDSHLSPGCFVSETCGAIAFKFGIKGKSSHAGVAPEKGINAIQLATEGLRHFPFGRISASATANIGIINGGTATNVVPDVVELEGADVALLVVFGFGEAFLEVAVFLEAVLLGHGFLLLLGLEDVACAAEVAQLSLENLVLAELAFERAVVHRYLD